jgi:hypothetical protein
MQRVIIFGLLSVLSVGQSVMVAQSVSESALGAWTLNRAKSTFSGPVPYGRVMKFEVVGDAVKETTYTFSTDKPSVLVEYTARFDGNDYPISNSILGMVSLKRVDDRTVERTGKIGGQALVLCTTAEVYLSTIPFYDLGVCRTSGHASWKPSKRMPRSLSRINSTWSRSSSVSFGRSITPCAGSSNYGLQSAVVQGV